MRVFRTYFLFATMLFLAASASAQTPATASVKPVSPLQPIAWLTGGVWKAEAKSDKGPPTKIESRVRWAENGNGILFDTSFNGKMHYSGFYSWDPGRKVIAFWYSSSDGELTVGTSTPIGDGVLMQEFDITGKDGVSHHLRSEIKRDGNDAYEWNVQKEVDGKWNILIHLRYTRG